MRFEGACDDHEMMIDHVELVQQSHMGWGDFRHEQVGIVGEEGVDVRLRGRGARFHGKGRDHAHVKGHASLLDYLSLRGDGVDGSPLTGIGRVFEQVRPEGAWFEEVSGLIHMNGKSMPRDEGKAMG